MSNSLPLVAAGLNDCAAILRIAMDDARPAGPQFEDKAA